MVSRARSLFVSACALSAIAGLPAAAQVFQGLGDLPGGDAFSGAYRVSRDGTTVVGYGYDGTQFMPFRWTQGTGMVSLGDFPGGLAEDASAYSVSANGLVVTGSGSDTTQPYVGFRWTQATGLVSIGDIDANPGTSSYANDVSDDGTVIAVQAAFGGNGAGGFVGQAARWTLGSGYTLLGFLPGGDYSSAAAVSADGSVIVGGGSVPGGGTNAFRWTQATGLVSLGDLPDGTDFSYAQDVSSDGRVVVGSATTAQGYLAMRWTQATGMVSLGDIPGGPHESFATGVSDDGNVIVGIANSTYDVDANGDAFIWTPQRGMRLLKDAVMVDYCAAQLEGWHLVSAWGISGDGRVIVGEGINPQGNWEAYVIRLGAGACPADFNHDGLVNVQDFLSYLQAFAAGC
jgi:probable HAF family extracellular repeat protein